MKVIVSIIILAITSVIFGACIVDTAPSIHPKQSPYQFPSEAPIWKTTNTIIVDGGTPSTIPSANRQIDLQNYMDADTQYGKDSK